MMSFHSFILCVCPWVFCFFFVFFNCGDWFIDTFHAWKNVSTRPDMRDVFPKLIVIHLDFFLTRCHYGVCPSNGSKQSFGGACPELCERGNGLQSFVLLFLCFWPFKRPFKRYSILISRTLLLLYVICVVQKSDPPDNWPLRTAKQGQYSPTPMCLSPDIRK